MPEHEPQVGQAERSITATSASETLASAAATIASMRSTLRVAGRELDLARLHRPAGDEHRRDVEAQRRHQHAGRDLVAVRDADQRVGAMGVGHVFDAVGDDLARRQRIEHAVVAHRDAVVDRDGVELLGDAARRLDLARDQLAEILQVHVAGHELGEGIGDRDDRLAEIAVASCRSRAKGRARPPCCGRGSRCGSDMEAFCEPWALRSGRGRRLATGGSHIFGFLTPPARAKRAGRARERR